MLNYQISYFFSAGFSQEWKNVCLPGLESAITELYAVAYQTECLLHGDTGEQTLAVLIEMFLFKPDIVITQS